MIIDHFWFFVQLSRSIFWKRFCPNYLKFDVRIVLYQVPFQIKLHVIRTNRFRDIDLGSWLKKKRSFLLGPPFTMIVWWSMIADKWSITIIDHHDDRDHRSRSVMIDGPWLGLGDSFASILLGENGNFNGFWNCRPNWKSSSIIPSEYYETKRSWKCLWQNSPKRDIILFFK